MSSSGDMRGYSDLVKFQIAIEPCSTLGGISSTTDFRRLESLNIYFFPFGLNDRIYSVIAVKFSSDIFSFGIAFLLYPKTS